MCSESDRGLCHGTLRQVYFGLFYWILHFLQWNRILTYIFWRWERVVCRSVEMASSVGLVYILLLIEGGFWCISYQYLKALYGDLGDLDWVVDAFDVTGISCFSHFTTDEMCQWTYCYKSPLQKTNTVKLIVCVVVFYFSSWGKWTDIQWCNSGMLKSFQLRVEPYQGTVWDDTAANNIK